MIGRFHIPCINDAGSAAVEFALIAPLLLVLCLGGLDATSAILASMRLTNAAADVADLVAEQTTVDASSIDNFCTAAQMDMAPLSSAPLQIAIASLTESSSGASIDWQQTCGGAPNISNATSLASGLIPDNGDSVIIVQATYQYPLPIRYLAPSSFKLSQTALYRPRDNTNVAFN